MNRLLFTIRNEAEQALYASKAAREILTMWLESIPHGDDEAEALRAGVVFDQVCDAITHLEKAVAVHEE